MTDLVSTGLTQLPWEGYRALYYESPTPAPDDAPRVVVITYTFPPDPSVGGLRWQEMARQFASRGWGVDVITRDFRGVYGVDTARLQRLPEGVRIFSVPSREPLASRAHKIAWPLVRRLIGERHSPGVDSLSRDEVAGQRGARTLVRAYLAWIEFSRDLKWARDAASLATIMIRTANVKVIISSGPPHMAHEAGRLAARRTGVAHVVDMRDPWSQNQFLNEAVASPVWLRLSRQYEGKAVADAALLTMNTEAACKALRGAYPEQAAKIHVVRNGSDDEHIPPPRRDGCFRIRFAGSIYMDRDPRSVFVAAQRVITELGLTPAQLMIEFVGQANKYAGRPTMRIAEELGIGEYVRVSGLVPRKRVMEFLAGATVLLSLPQGTDFAVPAKIYEYVRFPAWMLIAASAESATAQLLAGTEADVIEPSDLDGMTSVLRRRYQQFVRGEAPLPVGRDGRFNRSVQVEKLLDLLGCYCGPLTAEK